MNIMQKLCKPFKEYTKNSITQGFSANHTAIDFTAKWGTFLVAPFNCKITKVIDGGALSEDTTYLERGCGIRMTSIEDPKVSVVYWHCLGTFPVSEGDLVLQGQPVAQMGNTGNVMSNGQYVPISARYIQPFLGTHCHCTLNLDGDNAGFVDITEYIDESIEIKYDLKTTILSLITKIKSLWLK